MSLSQLRPFNDYRCTRSQVIKRIHNAWHDLSAVPYNLTSPSTFLASALYSSHSCHNAGTTSVSGPLHLHQRTSVLQPDIHMAPQFTLSNFCLNATFPERSTLITLFKITTCPISTVLTVLLCIASPTTYHLLIYKIIYLFEYINCLLSVSLTRT